ncbi:hypothetical protein AB3M83_12885 [Microbacterium sp. 179-B 1A2 NHS]|uniref:hypothetical protein n=1 Tax=Microbacterium sp. 179-B 1A2 NHS TaxID=3142383 RepID=UPI0039A3DCC7
MALTLAGRAMIFPPLEILNRAEARLRGIRLSHDTHHRVRPGAWVDRAAFRALRPWQRYAVRVHAFARTHPDGVLADESAAVLHGLPLFGEASRIHVIEPAPQWSRTRGDVQVHTTTAPTEVCRVGGILVTSLLDTVVALARVLPPAHALAVTDAAVSSVQGGTLTVGALQQRLAAGSTSRGHRRARQVLCQTDGMSESPGESVSRAVIAWCGFETPILQQSFTYEGREARVDFFFPASHAIGESDGWGKYELERPERAAELLRTEKTREDRLRRHGHPFARWDLRDAFRVVPLQQALSAAGVHRVRPANLAMLATLQSSTRSLPR